MLSKERETGTILVYVNNFSDPNILKTILNMISKSPKKIFYFSEATVMIFNSNWKLMMLINYRLFLNQKVDIKVINLYSKIYLYVSSVSIYAYVIHP